MTVHSPQKFLFWLPVALVCWGYSVPAIASEASITTLKPQTVDLPSLGDPERFLPPVVQQRLVLRLRDRKVYFYENDDLIASYPVAIGRQGWETPTGEFEIIQKVPNPTWQHPFTNEIVPPGPDNPLGDRWIGFWTDGTNYIGFHGTPDESLIGQAVSHGCVRMRNADIVALFEKVDVGMQVIVEN